MKYYTILILVFFTFNTFAQTSWYVNQSTGSDLNDGMSSATPFKTFDEAQDNVDESDTIFIIGEYHNDSYNPTFSYTNEHDPHLWHQENTIKVNNLDGTPGNYITIKAYDNSTILKGDGGNIFRVQNSSYLRIEGFEIEGEVDNILLSTAQALQFVYIDADNVVDEYDPTAAEINYRDQDCVSNCTAGSVVDNEVYSNIKNMNTSRPSYTDTRGMYLSDVNHIDIIDNEIHHMPGGGLRVSDCEDINIVGNEIHNCSRKSYSGTHALVVTKATSTRTTDDYRINILQNKIHHNYNEIYSWAPTKTIITPHIDEGKGISLQRNETTYNNDGSIKVNWENGKILVANNLCYYNGFSGVHSNDGNRIDIINNTCYFNSYTKSITQGITSSNGGNIGISAQGGSNIRIINNISVIDSDLSKSAISSNLTSGDGLVVRDNIIYGTAGSISEDADVVAVQVNTQMVNPLFTDAVNFDFSLQSSSPAINISGVTEAPTDDFFGQTRDGTPDLGAIEYVVVLPIELLFFDAILNNENIVELSWATLTEDNNDYFTIEKSFDGSNWQTIENIKGVGFSNTLQHYQTFDNQPQIGKNYYRLKQTDFDGQFEYSSIKTVDVKSSITTSINIFPNPTSDILQITGFNNHINNIQIINAFGVNYTHQIKTIEPLTFDVSNLPTGIYFIILDNVKYRFQVVQ